MDLGSYLLLLSAAFFASLSHCVGMCGGIVIGLNMRHFEDSKILQALANILYFFGRMCGYIIIGLCFVLIGKSFIFSETAKAIIFIVLGILLFITAFIVTFKPKILGNITPSGNYVWYKKAFHSAMHSKSIFGFFIIGILNGFLPCHLVYMFAIKAADSLSVLHSVFSMLIFSIGTFLPLFLLGFFSHQLLHSAFRRIFLYIAFIIMCYFAISSIYKGTMLLKNPHSMHHQMMNMQHNQTMPLNSNTLESNLMNSGTLDSKNSYNSKDSNSHLHNKHHDMQNMQNDLNDMSQHNH